MTSFISFVYKASYEVDGNPMGIILGVIYVKSKSNPSKHKQLLSWNTKDFKKIVFDLFFTVNFNVFSVFFSILQFFHLWF